MRIAFARASLMLMLTLASVLATALNGNDGARFVDVTEKAGITFEHRHGGGGDKHIMETVGGGASLWDYDGDGDLDIYFLNGAPLPGYEGPQPLWNALYRNDGGRFVDVTAEAGLTEPGYSMGCVVADYDNDGDLDLYITSFGKNRLYRNNGDGTFADVTERAGVADARLGASAAFGDIEGDGDLDLYVTNYVAYTLENSIYCGNRAEGIHTYCHPNNYEGAFDVLYRNEGDGTFTDVSSRAGIDLPGGKGLGVIFVDLDEDGDADIYVANDSVMNFFFRNLGDGRFEETALSLGVGFSEDGRPEAGMGLDFGDYDGDEALDLFVTNYELETNTLYRNLGDGTFMDTTYQSGLALPSLPWVGFGTGFFDLDNDGDQDLFVANGHVMDHPQSRSDATSYAQRNQLYENDGGHFSDISAGAGEYFREERVSRGVAFGDWDNDGDPDLLVANNNAAPDLLRNDNDSLNHWTLLHLVGRNSNRDGIGAFVRLTAGGKVQVDAVRSGGSYLSQSDLRLHFGLGASPRIDRLELRWPSGLEQVFEDLPGDQLLLIREGGEPEVSPMVR